MSGETRMTRRSLLRIGGGIVLGSAAGYALAGCGTQNSTAEAEGTVLMWVYPLIGTGTADQVMWNRIAADFHRKNPKVQVTIQVQPWDNRVEKLTAALAARRGPDVWYINPEDIINHAQHHRLVDLGGILTSADRKDYFPSSLQSTSWQGRQWAIPLLTDVNSTFWNTAVFKKAGIDTYPRTWKEVMDVAPKLKARGYYVLQIDPTDAEDQFYPYIFQAGGTLFSSNGKRCLLNSSACVSAMEFVANLVRQKYAVVSTASQTGVPVTETPLGRQQVAMGVNNVDNSGIVQLEQAWKANNVQVAPPLTDRFSKAIGTVGGLAVSTQAKSVAAAKAWVKYVTSASVQAHVDRTTSYFSPRRSQNGLYPRSTQLGQLEAFLPRVVATPMNLYARQVSDDILSAQMEAVFAGEKSPKAAMDAAASQADSLMAGNS